MKRLIKKSKKMSERDSALVYIDGEIMDGAEHYDCIDKYFKRKHIDESLDGFYRMYDSDEEEQKIVEKNIKQMAFASQCIKEKIIYVERDTLYNIELETAINEFKSKYPDYIICIDETNEKVARLKKGKITKIASNISQDFDSFMLGSGDIIAIGCRLVNNKPWYQVYQEGLYNTSSYYDGADYDRALQMYKDLLTAFQGVGKTENFTGSEAKIKQSIESLIDEKKSDEYNFQKSKSNSSFLGGNNSDW